MTKKELRSAIKQDLLNQLERNGTIGQYYTDLVDDYMTAWDTKNQLAADIRQRGAVVDYTSNTGQINKRKNESVNEFLKTNAQMLKLLDSIGIKPAQLENIGDADDEM